MKLNKFFCICLSIFCIAIQGGFALEWVEGSLHQHTGYSTILGPDRLPFTGDGCSLFKELNFLGYTVDELKEDAENLNLEWLAFSDHSYCINSSEFNIVKEDCERVRDSGFTCLMGEEVSVSDKYDDGIDELIWWTCHNKEYGEAHEGAYGIDTLIEQTPSEKHCPDTYSAQGGINQINAQGGISILNHPILTGWTSTLDFDSYLDVSGETGIEIWNKEWDEDNEGSKNLWIMDFLQQGEKVFAYGGTDEHGSATRVNYNVVGVDSLTHSNLQKGLEDGRLCVSNNGYVKIKAKTNTQETWTEMGDDLHADTDETITLRAEYDLENSDCMLTLYKSLIKSYDESDTEKYISGSGLYDEEYRIIEPGDYYFRAECISSNEEYRIYTNPVWVTIHEAPQEGDLIVSNTGDATLSVTSITDNKDWITYIAPTSFTLDEGESQGVFVTVDPDGYSPGFYSGTVSIYSNDPDENPKTVTVTMDIPKYDDRDPCTSDSDCQSGYCDNDGDGWGDDDWCFSVEDTYYDNQDHKCEESARSANDDWCDEKRDEDINRCDKTGEVYKEDTCSDTCGLSDKSIFECYKDGCSCSEPLCDNLETGDSILTCAADYTYFADKCTSIAGGEDRGDNICRSADSLREEDGCTADTECNGQEAGVGNCNSSCSYVVVDAPPNVTLISPADNSVDDDGTVVFNCSAEDDFNLVNMTLYGNWGGSWHANETKSLSGISDSVSFSKNLINGIYAWNCLAYDNASQSNWANSNWTINVTVISDLQVNNLSVLYENSTERIFTLDILNKLNYTNPHV